MIQWDIVNAIKAKNREEQKDIPKPKVVKSKKKFNKKDRVESKKPFDKTEEW